MSVEDLQRKLALQKKAFLKNQCPSIDERKQNVGKIAQMVLSNRDAIHEALQKDFGNHPRATSDLVEVLGVAGRAQYVISQLDKWMQEDRRDVDPQLYGKATAVMTYQPKGVIANIVPFNFPLDLSLGPLCEMLAAGNRVIIKPSEFTPAVGELLAKMVAETFPEDLVTVVNGGLDVAKAVTQAKFNHILYTGSTQVGKLVMGEAAKNLASVTLELGGKSPAIFMADTVTQRNVDHVLQVKLLKNGNVCVTPDHVVLPESKLDEFLSLAKEYFSKNGLDDYVNSDQCTGIITDRHYERLVKLIKEAEETGVKSVTLGGDSPYGNAKTRAMPLTILVNPGSELAVSQEEIFGPILPVITYKDLDAAIDHINEGERPLGLYIFSDDEKETQRLINETNSGGLSVNSCAMQAALPSLGFGGSGHSGMGNHHGWEGFREFTNHRGVFRRGPASEQDLIPAFGPPFAFGEQVAAGAYQAAGM